MAEQFTERAACFVDQYSQFPIDMVNKYVSQWNYDYMYNCVRSKRVMEKKMNTFIDEVRRCFNNMYNKNPLLQFYLKHF